MVYRSALAIKAVVSATSHIKHLQEELENVGRTSGPDRR
jgi:hypothetical protein